MRKSRLALAAVTSALTLAGLYMMFHVVVAGILLWLMAAFMGTLVHAASLSLTRQQKIEVGEPDVFLALNASRSEAAILADKVRPWSGLRRWFARTFFGHRLMVADRVRVKSLDEIRRTLDADECLDGLPFMAEMAAYCGSTGRVYRVIDKVYDYGRSRQMRSLADSVLLLGLRCDGSAHGGCEAACYLIWKTAWLENDDAQGSVKADLPRNVMPIRQATPTDRYSCQYTQLTSASRPVRWLGLHGWLGPLVVGNVTFAAFRVAVLTRLFNGFQKRRGGVRFPALPHVDPDRLLPSAPLRPGDWVRVRFPHEIARTLDKNSKNRGLWFDSDMLKFCGQSFRVRGRIERIIDVGSGAMIPMKTPCIALDEVHYTGEFQGFGVQFDYLYWREVWLQRISDEPAAASAGSQA